MGSEQSKSGQASKATVSELKERNEYFGTERRVLKSDKAPAAIGPYSQGISLNNVTFLSGQVGIIPGTKNFAKPMSDQDSDVAAQTRQALKNLSNVLHQDQGATLDDVVKTTVLLTDMAHFQAMNQEYAKFFPVHPPARACYAVKGLPLNALVEIEAVAMKKQLLPAPGTTDTPAHPELGVPVRELFPPVNGQEDEIPVFTIADKNSAKGGVVVIQEWWGVTPDILSQARHIAAQGYYVCVPDIYKGKLGVNAEEGHHLMDNLDWEQALKEIQAVALHMKSQLNPEKNNIGVVGFCMGGALAIAAGTNFPEQFSCACSFYGIPPKQLADVSKNLKIPVQGHFGLLDTMTGFSDPAAADLLEKDGKENVKVYRYDNVGHAFMNSSPLAVARKEALGQTGSDTGAIHDPDSIRQAWGRLFSFFNANI